MIIGQEAQISDVVKELIKEKPASSIPVERPVEIIQAQVDPFTPSEAYWAQKSQELLTKYNYGKGLGKFGNNSKGIDMMFSRLAEAITETVKSECLSSAVSADELALHFKALSSIMILLAKELEKLKVDSITHENLLAIFHGFIESYLQEVLRTK